MATAILLFYTSDGFLLAADGRVRMNAIVTGDETQKIFSISEPTRSLAYAFGGSVGLTDKDDARVIFFDFRDEATSAIKSLSKARYRDLPTYASKLAKRLQNRLERAHRNKRVEPLKDDPTGLVACLVLAGYYANAPSAVLVQFRHDGNTLLRPVVATLPLNKGYFPIMCYGSEEVRQQVFLTDNPDFTLFRVPKVNAPENVAILEVASAAKNYILACSEPAAMAIDPVHCAGIGGHIHIAKITPAGGFQWIAPPKQSPVTASTT